MAAPRDVTQEILAAAQVDQGQTFTFPHPACPAFNTIYTYNAQYTVDEETIPFRGAFVRPETDIPRHWERKLRPMAVAGSMIVGKMRKPIIMEAYHGEDGLNGQNGLLKFMQRKLDPHISLRRTAFPGATERRFLGLHSALLECHTSRCRRLVV